MKEIDNKEQTIDKSSETEKPETARESENKKAQFGNSLDSMSTSGTLKSNDAALDQSKNKEDQSDRTRVTELKNEQKNLEPTDEDPGTKLDRLSSTGAVKENAAPETERAEQVSGVKEITQPYYDAAQSLAQKSEMGANFTDHTEAHVEQVAEKSLEAADALEKAIEKGSFQTESSDPDRINFAGNVDKAALAGAALSHDTGMRGDGYAVKTYKDENQVTHFAKDADGNFIIDKENNDNFDEVRSNHSLNSAINVLADREKYKEQGYSDEQVDMMAAECMAHSKSSSGVHDLNSRKDWAECFDCMDSVVERYNQDHPDAPIEFHRERFEQDDEKFGQLATSTLALRVGDVSRDSGPDAVSQSGDAVHVDRSTINDKAPTAEAEVKDADIKRGDVEMTNEVSRRIHAGEQNITDNHMVCREDGSVCHQISVDDGSSAPRCTISAIDDHVKELQSAKGGEFVVEVEFDKPCSPEARKAYEEYQDKVADSNVQVIYPWDKEEES